MLGRMAPTPQEWGGFAGGWGCVCHRVMCANVCKCCVREEYERPCRPHLKTGGMCKLLVASNPRVFHTSSSYEARCGLCICCACPTSSATPESYPRSEGPQDVFFIAFWDACHVMPPERGRPLDGVTPKLTSVGGRRATGLSRLGALHGITPEEKQEEGSGG